VPVRFPTARSLFETFPEAALKAAEAPADAPSLAFLQNLAAAEKFEDAVTFCAYLLPRREAVWWACRSARALLGDGADDSAPGKTSLLAAEAWVRNPDDEHREAALRIGSAGDVNDPMTWLAMAAGWAGGMFVSHPKNPVPVPQYMTARACRIAVLLLSARLPKEPERRARLRACIADGAGLAEAGL
jgi:hypothetical protein